MRAAMRPRPGLHEPASRGGGGGHTHKHTNTRAGAHTKTHTHTNRHRHTDTRTQTHTQTRARARAVLRCWPRLCVICVDDAGLPAAVSSDDPTIYAAHFCTMREPKETYSRVCARFPHEHTLFGLRVVQKGALKPNTSGACLLLLLLLLPFAAVLQPDADAAAAAAAIKTNPDVPSRRVPTTRCRTLPARHATTAWGTRAAMECRASRFVPSVTWAVCNVCTVHCPEDN